MNKPLLFVTDPWSTLEPTQDTTLRLMEEAQILNIPCYWADSDFVFEAGKNFLSVIKVNQTFLPTHEREKIKASFFSQVHFRVDPPVDKKYCGLVARLLEFGVNKNQLLNPPDIITRQSEKLPPPDLMDLAPIHHVIKNENDARLAFELFKNHAEVVTKPMNLAQSIGVKKLTLSGDETRFLDEISKLTKNYSTEIIIEEFLPEVLSGEVRLWFSNGNFIAALKKHPKSGDFRVLIDEGSLVTKHTLTPKEEQIADRISNSLKNQGIALAAIDLIGNKICDYNITSPGLLKQLERVHNKNFAQLVLIKLLEQ